MQKNKHRALRGCLSVLILALGFGAGVPPAQAGLVNDVPSCYAANKITPPQSTYDKLAYVLIDQTVLLDASLQKSVMDNIMNLLAPGTKFVIAEFSAFSQGRYLSVLSTGVVESPIPVSQEGSIVMTRLNDFKTCLKAQRPYAQRMALSNAAKAMASASKDLARSDVLMAFKAVSTAVREEPVKAKVVFAVTDGLENSAITSFYSHDAVRDVNVDAEMKKVQENELTGDFGGAKVFILGGGMMVAAAKGSVAARNGYRDPKTLLDLNHFWAAYFRRSNAELVEFGAPALLKAVKY